MTPFPNQFNRTVCVSSCPTVYSLDPSTGAQDTSGYTLPCKTTTNVASCDDSTGIFTYATAKTATFDTLKTTIWYYKSSPFLGKVCMPSDYNFMLNQVNFTSMQDYFTGFTTQINDLTIAWPVMLGSVAIAFVIGIIYLFVLRICSGLIVWVFILLILGVELALASLFY